MKNMKLKTHHTIKKIVLFLLMTMIASQSFSQIGYSDMLAECDSLLAEGEYIKAYLGYNLLYKDFAEHKEELTEKKKQCRRAIDQMKTDIENTIAQAEQKQRNYERSCVEYAVWQEKQDWLEQNSDNKPEYFEIDEHITKLNLSGFGMVQLPEKITEFDALTHGV